MEPRSAPTLPDAALSDIREIAALYRSADTLLMQAVTLAGGMAERGLRRLPAQWHEPFESLVKGALMTAYEAARRSRTMRGVEPRIAARTGGRLAGDGAHRALATLTGAVGGAGGLPSAAVELPVTVTLIFRSIQAIAAEHGHDPESEATRVECLRVFDSGGPMSSDDGVNTGFLTARIGLTGVSVQRMIAMIAPRLAAVLGQKLAAQTVPVLGAVTGAAINYAFIQYYQTMARVRFRLMALARTHGVAEVAAAFRAELAAPMAARKRTGRMG
jgi:hypothetical protein